jgi:hypothetical protein
MKPSNDEGQILGTLEHDILNNFTLKILICYLGNLNQNPFIFNLVLNYGYVK